MSLIKLTQVGARQQASALAAKQHADGRPIEVNWGAMTEEDMIAKEIYIRPDQILAITFPNDAIPVAKSVLLTSVFGELMVAEEPEEVARLCNRIKL